MAFPRQFLDELISRSDIVDVVSSYVALTRKGGNLFGLCPFHNEKTGSFSVSPDKQIYHCFGCKHGGGVINFIMEIENLPFPDAVRFLAKRANMDVPEDGTDRAAAHRRQRLLELNREAARWFYQNLSQPEGAAVAAYIDKRRISRKTAMDFGLGASPNRWDGLMTAMLQKGFTKTELLEARLVRQNNQGRLYDTFRNRLMLPIIDIRGDVVGFGSRALDSSLPKYMNSPDSPVYSKRHTLYALNLAKRTKRPNMILCEGNIDVITLHQAGFDNAVASMGTSLTEEQTRLLSRYTKELILCYDNDEAGRQATERAISMLEKSEFTIRVLQLPRRMVDGEYVKQDVDDFIKLHGGAAFEALLGGSENQMDFRMNEVAAKYDLGDGQQKIAYAEEISRLIAAVPNAVEREVYAGRAAEAAGISREAMLLEIKRAYGKQRHQEKRAIQRENLNVSALRQPRDRAIRYTDVRSAMAEEGVLRLLFLDSSLAQRCTALDAGDFSSPLLGRIYRAALDAWEEGRSISPAALTELLQPEEMSHLTALLQKPESLAGADRSLPDYIQIITDSAGRRRADTGADPLLAAKEKYKDKKGYGGKRNG